VNWHFKPEDQLCAEGFGTSVLIRMPTCCISCASDTAGVTALSVPTPPEPCQLQDQSDHHTPISELRTLAKTAPAL
jgi:hypothetical protein